jgi:O-antigen/teichoic acid export membrane protein
MVRLARVKEIFKFSVNVELSYLFRMMLDPLNKILIVYFGSVSMVALYEVAWKIITLSVGLMWGLQNSLLPALSAANAKRGHSSVKLIFHYSLKYLGFVVVPLFSIIFIFSRPFIQTWLGDGFEVSIITLQILVFPYMLSVLVNPAIQSVQGIGYSKYNMFMHSIRGVLSLTLGYTFIRLYGYYGLIVGHAIAVIISSIYIQMVFHKVLMVSIKQVISIVSNRILVVNITVSVFLFALVKFINPTGYFILILFGVLFFCLSTYSLVSMKWADDKDKQILKDVLPGYIFRKLNCTK